MPSPVLAHSAEKNTMDASQCCSSRKTADVVKTKKKAVHSCRITGLDAVKINPWYVRQPAFEAGRISKLEQTIGKCKIEACPYPRSPLISFTEKSYTYLPHPLLRQEERIRIATGSSVVMMIGWGSRTICFETTVKERVTRSTTHFLGKCRM